MLQTPGIAISNADSSVAGGRGFSEWLVAMTMSYPKVPNCNGGHVATTTPEPGLATPASALYHHLT